MNTTDHHAATSPFAVAYRDNVGEITSFFARRVNEPQLVADLVSETFVEAIGSLKTFDPTRGTARAWLFAIARRVFARWYAAELEGRRLAERLAGLPELHENELEELARRIDAQAEGRRLLARCAGLPDLERSAVELVDLAGFTPRERPRPSEPPRGHYAFDSTERTPGYDEKERHAARTRGNCGWRARPPTSNRCRFCSPDGPS